MASNLENLTSLHAKRVQKAQYKFLVGRQSNSYCSTNQPTELVGLNELQHGIFTVPNRRRKMEDRVVVERDLFGGDYLFFAIYDGHGGWRVADMCAERLHQILEREVEGMKENSTEICWEKILKQCFLRMEEEITTNLLNGVAGDDAPRLDFVGSTAVVVIVGNEEVVVANCGDSRAVMCSSGVVIPLSNDHKPDHPDEKARIEAAGGNVVYWDGIRVCGVLATSRSLGDTGLKPCVSYEPDVTVTKRTTNDEFIIIASDGLWDVVSNNRACNLVRDCFQGKISNEAHQGNGSVEEAAMNLGKLAIAKRSLDNISVLVVKLKNLI